MTNQYKLDWISEHANRAWSRMLMSAYQHRDIDNVKMLHPRKPRISTGNVEINCMKYSVVLWTLVGQFSLTLYWRWKESRKTVSFCQTSWWRRRSLRWNFDTRTWCWQRQWPFLSFFVFTALTRVLVKFWPMSHQYRSWVSIPNALLHTNLLVIG